MEKTFLVTGGAGFIGSNLCEMLVREGFRVRVLDNLSTGKEENLRDLIDDIEFIEGDIRDGNTVDKAMKGVDCVVHLAALGSVSRSVEAPETTHDVNATGTLTVLDSARRNGVRRLVYASSSSVYGDTPVLPKRVDMSPTPQSPYAVSKLTGEYYCRVFYRVYGLETVSLRYFNVYGRRQDPASRYAAVIPRFITSLLEDRAPTIFGDGEQSRDFTFVDDCNQANLKASLSDNCAGRVFNVGYGARVTINELLKKIQKALGKEHIKPIYTEARKGDVRHSLADISGTKEFLSYEPRFNIDAGIEMTVKWFKSVA